MGKKIIIELILIKNFKLIKINSFKEKKKDSF